jgi:hypothetical protein
MGKNIGKQFEKTLDNHACNKTLENHWKPWAKHKKPNGKPWEKNIENHWKTIGES